MLGELGAYIGIIEGLNRDYAYESTILVSDGTNLYVVLATSLKVSSKPMVVRAEKFPSLPSLGPVSEREIAAQARRG